MSEPSREHVEALRDEIGGWPIGSGYYATRVGTDEAREIAEHLLTSTDPAVLDAMQDALVRANRIAEERETETYYDGFERPILETRTNTRIVTEWTEADQ